MTDWDLVSVLSRMGVDFEWEGSNIRVRGIASIDRATEKDLAFCWYVGEKGISYISQSKAGVILCKREMQGVVHPNSRQLLIFTDNPRLTFVRDRKSTRLNSSHANIS